MWHPFSCIIFDDVERYVPVEICGMAVFGRKFYNEMERCVMRPRYVADGG